MNITNENIFQVHSETLEQVHQNDYYLNILDRLEESSEINTSEDIVIFWNKFWFSLPDNKAIHRPPFYTICDLCEFDYRDEEILDEEVAF